MASRSTGTTGRFTSGRRVAEIKNIELDTGTAARLACSWRSAAGCDAQIAITVYGTKGGAAFRNAGGSFCDFVAERYRGTSAECLCAPPDAWGGRAAVVWVQQLRQSNRFRADVQSASLQPVRWIAFTAVIAFARLIPIALTQ